MSAAARPQRDGLGNPIDPTANVIALTRAANQRQDDLRKETNRRYDAEILHLREMIFFRSELANLRAQHQSELRAAESARLDAIRQIDREEGNKAATASQTAIATLAATASTTAETLRTQVATTALAQQNSFATSNAEIQKRLSALELAGSEGRGKQAVADPIFSELVQEMKSLRQSRSQVTGKSEGINFIGALIVGIVVVLSGCAGIAGVLYAMLKP